VQNCEFLLDLLFGGMTDTSKADMRPGRPPSIFHTLFVLLFESSRHCGPVMSCLVVGFSRPSST